MAARFSLTSRSFLSFAAGKLLAISGKRASFRVGSQVFDEQHLIANLVVDEFVDGAASEEQAVASGTNPFGFALKDVGDRVRGGIGDGGMAERFAAEAGAGIADVKDQRPGGANPGDLDDLVGVESCSVLHGVQQDFAKAFHQLIARLFGCFGGEFANEGHEPLGGEQAAVCAKRDPAGTGGEHLDIVAPFVVRSGAGGEVGDIADVEGWSEAGKDLGAQGGNDFFRIAVSRENDALHAGTNRTHLFEQREVFFDGGFGTGNDDAEGPGAQLMESVGVAGGLRDGDPGGGERCAHCAAYLGMTSDDQDLAHAALRKARNGMILVHGSFMIRHTMTLRLRVPPFFAVLSSCLSLVLGASAIRGFAQQATTAQAAPQTDSSYIDEQGTAHVTRVVPVPKSLSPEAQARVGRPASDANVPQTLEQRRTGTDKWQLGAGEKSKAIYPVKIGSETIAGVPVRIIDPTDATPVHPDRVLINLHGGGFNSDSGSFTESIPIANLAHTRVISVLYRLAPEHPFPASVDDVVAVYREVLKTYKPAKIGIYGTAAGAILTAEVASKFRQLGLPMPGALGIFSGMGDFSLQGDSIAMYALNGLSGHLDIPGPARNAEYVGSADLKDPVLSPIYADLHGFPPTLFITSGRDLLLSGTTTLHRAFLRAGVDAQLIEFEGLPHAFWNDVSLPESKEAYGYMAGFFDRELGR